MDFVNQTIAQIRELFASMTPGARVTAGLLVAVVVISMGFLFQQVSVGPDEYLFGGESLDRRQLPRMEAAMSAAGIKYETQGTKIRVSPGDKNAAIAAIADAGELPPEFHKIMDDAINGGSLFDFRDTKMQRMRAAREHQASLILGDFPWVEKADVIYNERQGTGLNASRHATAAVSILPAVGESLNSQRARAVKEFVSGACDVAIEDIVITNLGSDMLAGGDGGVSADDFEHPLDRLRVRESDRLRNIILKQLSDIPGVRVEVNPRIDPKSEERVVQITPESEPVTLSKKEQLLEESHTAGGDGSRVGVEAQAAQGPPSANRDDVALAQDQTTKTSENKDIASAVGTKRMETVTAGFVLEEAEASVVVPISYVKAVFRERNPTPEGQAPKEIDANQLDQLQTTIRSEIEGIVEPLLPKLALGENDFKQVKVNFVTDLPQAAFPSPSIATSALGMLGTHANTLAMLGLAVVGLVMLRSMVTSAGGNERTAQSMPSLKIENDKQSEADAMEGDEAQRPKLKLRKADTLKGDLSEMVASDPDAAAAILRSWINNAA
jgi:flagellar M-ring protein FliF